MNDQDEISQVGALRDQCRKSGSSDVNSYAPSVVVESDLERFNLQSGRVIYSRRKSTREKWNQTSIRATQEHRALRERLIELSRETAKK